MVAVARRGMSLAEFLAWEAEQPERWEFDGFEPVAMTGGSRAHSLIAVNLLAALVTRLRGGPCRPFNGDLKILANGRIRYPDAFVACGNGANADLVEEAPAVVFEILPPSAASTDAILKMREYRATPSIMRYVMLSQTEVAANVFVRRGEDWVAVPASEFESVLAMPEIGVELPLSEVYEGVLEA